MVLLERKLTFTVDPETGGDFTDRELDQLADQILSKLDEITLGLPAGVIVEIEG